MKTHVSIDENLVEKVLKLGSFKHKREAVEEALKFFVKLKKQGEILKLKGKLKWESD